MEEPTGTCPRCGAFGGTDVFYRNRTTKSGLHCHCKNCCRIQDKEKRFKRKNINQRLIEEQYEKGCFVCGITDTVVLEFHHYYELKAGGRKKKSQQHRLRISEIKHKVSKVRFTAELSKCYVLCANDHKRVHAGQIILEPPDLL